MKPLESLALSLPQAAAARDALAALRQIHATAPCFVLPNRVEVIFYRSGAITVSRNYTILEEYGNLARFLEAYGLEPSC